jgi:hypothetical protein
VSRVLLVRAADQGATYLTWRWLDDPRQPCYALLDTAALTAALDELRHALPHPLEGETDTQAAARALADGAFADPGREHALATRLAAAVLPAPLAAALAATGTGPALRLRVIPSPRLARLPWELLALPDDRRLLEVADICADPPATLHAGRGRQPTPWPELTGQPVLYLLDPKTPGDLLPPVLDDDGRDSLEAWLNERLARGQILPDDWEIYALCGEADRCWLGKRLRESPAARLLYYGHASSADEEIGSAALHLADGPGTYGLAGAIGGHRPFTALDLLIGTLTAGAAQETGTLPCTGRRPGHEIWPMPPRVAIIACDSGGDHRHVEPFGLVMACLNAGAELVTATRWALPTDHAFTLQGCAAPGPTTALMRQVDLCHEDPDPVTALSAWQRGRLTAWTDRGDLRDTPLLWAALTTHHAPARPPDPR